MLFSSKKAMSPLIATVLLIAFAVALGAMIMNWSDNVINDDTIDASKVCEDVRLQNNGDFCYSNNRLNLGLKNNGVPKIEQVRLNSSSSVGDLALALKDSSMIQGESIELSVPFIYDGGEIRIDLIPVLNYDGTLVECRAVGRSSLPDC